MNSKFLKRRLLILSFILVSATVYVWAQSNQPSPAATAKGTVNGANISIEYSSPSVKGRKIFGGLLPYDKIWRAGANKATVFTTDKKITVEGKSLAAGSYSVYMTPGVKTWKVIFNSETGQWGTTHGGESTHDAAKDVIVVEVKPAKTKALVESLKYEVTAKGVALSWENTLVPIAIK